MFSGDSPSAIRLLVPVGTRLAAEEGHGGLRIRTL